VMVVVVVSFGRQSITMPLFVGSEDADTGGKQPAAEGAGISSTSGPSNISDTAESSSSAADTSSVTETS